MITLEDIEIIENALGESAIKVKSARQIIGVLDRLVETRKTLESKQQSAPTSLNPGPGIRSKAETK